MLDTRSRKYFEPLFIIIARFFIKLGLSANHITFLAFIFGVSSGIFVFFNKPIIGIIILWISGLLDAIDGNVARITNTQSKLGAQFDIVSDRIVELSIIWSLALRNEEALYSLLLLVSCILISITVFLTTGMISINNSKKSFYYQAGLMERTEGFILSTFMILFQNKLVLITYIYSILIIITIFQRLYETVKLNMEKK